MTTRLFVLSFGIFVFASYTDALSVDHESAVDDPVIAVLAQASDTANVQVRADEKAARSTSAPHASLLSAPANRPGGVYSPGGTNAPTLPNSCSFHGNYINDRGCICDDGYIGIGCEHKCPQNAKTGEICGGKGWCGWDPCANKAVCVCKDNPTVACSSCGRGRKCDPKPKATAPKCMNGGIASTGALAPHMNSTCHKQQCICSRTHVSLTGLLCEQTLKDLPQNEGWPTDGCTGKQLISRDMAPMQWIRQTRLMEVDNIRVFKPFESTKIPILKDIKVVFEAPLLTSADTRQGKNMNFALGCYIRLYDWVVRATFIIAQTQGDGHSLGRRLLTTTQDEELMMNRVKLEAREEQPTIKDKLAAAKGKVDDAVKKQLALWAGAIRLDLPRGIRLSDFFPFLKHNDKCREPFIDRLRISKAAIYFATGALNDMEMALIPGDALTGVEVGRGVTVMFELQLSVIKELGLLGEIFGGTKFQASMNLAPFGSFNIGFGIATTLPKPFSGFAGKVSFELRTIADYPSTAGMSMTARLRLGFDIGGEAVAFQGLFTVMLKGPPFSALPPVPQMPVRFDADLLGCVKEPFGIQGFELCDVAIGFGIDALALGTGNFLTVINYFRLQGGVILGEGKSQKKILMYLKIDFAEATKSAILGQCKEPIRLVDLLNIPIRMARKVGTPIPTIPTPPFPILELRDFVVKASMADIYIAKEQFRMGLNLQFNLTILGVRLEVDCLVDQIFIKVKMSVTPFSFAGLKLAGLGCDMKPDSGDEGLCLWIELGVKPWRAKFQFTGVFSILGLLSAGGHAEISERGFYLGFVYPFGIFNTDVAIWSNNMDEILDVKGGVHKKGQEGFGEEFVQTQFDNDLSFRVTMHSSVLDWMSEQIDRGVEMFRKIMDEAIKKSNQAIDDAASKVRNCGGLKEEDELELSVMDDSKRQQIVDDSIRRIRRYTLPAEEMALIDDSLPIRMEVSDLQVLIQRYVQKQEQCNTGKLAQDKCIEAYDMYNDMSDPNDMDEDAETLDVEEALSSGVVQRQQWGAIGRGFKKYVVEPVSAGVEAIKKHVVQPIGKAAKTAVKHIKEHVVDPVGKAVVEAGEWVGEQVSSAAKAAWRGITSAAKFVAKIACKAVANFLDTVVKNVVAGLMEVGKWTVYTGGKIVAQALSSVFNVRKIEYTASVQGLIRANLGTFAVDATVIGVPLDFKLELALLRWAGVGQEEIEEGQVELDSSPGKVVVMPAGETANVPLPHGEPIGYLMTEQMDELEAYNMAGHDLTAEPFASRRPHSLVATQASRRLLERVGASWGGHNPHRHNPHSHNPHSHNPHSHNPHSHTPHRHSAAPTKHPTRFPTQSPTRTPKAGPTAKPSAKPETDKDMAAKNFEKGGHKASCAVLSKLGYGRSCTGDKIATSPVSPKEIEENLESQFNIKHGDTVNIVNQQTKTFVAAEAGGVVGVMGGKETTALTYTVHVPGGGSVRFGETFTLKSQCFNKFLAKQDSKGTVKAAHSTEASAGVKFSLFDARNVAQRGVVRDFSIVGIKAHDGQWIGVNNEGQLLANRHSITDGAAVHFSIFKIHTNHPKASHCTH